MAFGEAWRQAQGLPRRPRATELDAWLHGERVDSRTRRQRTRPAVAGDLPDRVMIRHQGVVGLLAGGHLLPWSFAGYGTPVPVDPTAPVDLLTPPATAATLAAGYRPLLHPTASCDGAGGRARSMMKV